MSQITDRIVRTLILAILGGLLAVLGWFACTILVAQLGQDLIQHSTGASPPPKSEFYDADLFRTVVPLLFAAGFFGILLDVNPKRGRSGRRQHRRSW
jgi:hypothetical protein